MFNLSKIPSGKRKKSDIHLPCFPIKSEHSCNEASMHDHSKLDLHTKAKTIQKSSLTIGKKSGNRRNPNVSEQLLSMK